MEKTIHYAVHDLQPYVNWIYFFFAWGFSPRFASVATAHDCAACRSAWVNSFPDKDIPQAREAAKLYADALKALRELDENEACCVSARYGLYTAWSEGDDIVVLTEQGEQRLPFLRQQHAKVGEPCLCLADFIAPKERAIGGLKAAAPTDNTLGIFVTAASVPDVDDLEVDGYRRMLLQTLGDRLAEAAAEKMHEDVRRSAWGYAPDEHLSPNELFAEKYQGRRPAVGYPSLPDQSFIFLLDRLLHFDAIGVTLTESGMMQPHAAVAGLLFGHPACRHFAVGRIDETQLRDYAARRGEDPEQLRRYLTSNMR